jgi:hypothetical protein
MAFGVGQLHSKAIHNRFGDNNSSLRLSFNLEQVTGESMQRRFGDGRGRRGPVDCETGWLELGADIHGGHSSFRVCFQVSTMCAA